MRRSKQKAAAFLASAFVIGGLSGAAGNAWYSQFQKSSVPFRGAGERLFDDLGLSCEQRERMDSILRTSDRRVDSIRRVADDSARVLNAPLRARADSILAPARVVAMSITRPAQAAADSVRTEAREAFLDVMTERQRSRYDRLMEDAALQRKEWEQRSRDNRGTRQDVCGGSLSQGLRELMRRSSGGPSADRRPGEAPANGDSLGRSRSP